MKDEAFLSKLREAFAIEAEEHVQSMTAGLLELEQVSAVAKQKELIEVIFREAHSLKGAAGAVDRSDLQAICQVLESIFSEWKRQPSPVTAETFDILNRALDLVRKLLRLPAASEGAAEQEEVQAMVRQLGEVTCTPVLAAVSPQNSLPAATKVRAPKAAVSVAAQAIPTPVAKPPTAPVVSEHVAADDVSPQLSETVRIPMAKMDSLLRQAEEMIAVKLTASQHAAEVRGLHDRIETWHQAWAKVGDSTRTGLVGQSAAVLTKLGDFLEWNHSFMQALDRHLIQLKRAAERDERGIGTLVDDLLEDARHLVMLPFSTLLDLFPKLVRDLARTQGKEAVLVLHGREVEIDKRILQEMKDPLIHLVRNSLDHGLEPPAERVRAQKPASGTVTISVAQIEAGKVEISITDDGGGIQVAKVKAAAVRSGALSEDEAAQLDDATALPHIFDSGVSTSPIITEISGRGLGMAIVREKVEKLGGRITTETAQGRGTTFRITVPITLATFKGILVGAGGQCFVIPTTQVECIKRVPLADIQTMENTESFSLNGHAISFVRLDEVLGLPPRGQAQQGGYVEVVVLGTGDKRIGFAVDEVFHEQEVLVKSLGRPLLRVRNVVGATILGSSTPAIILNTSDLLKSAVRMAGGGSCATRSAVPDTAARKRSVLVTDDSVTSRMLLKNILGRLRKKSLGHSFTERADTTKALGADASHQRGRRHRTKRSV